MVLVLVHALIVSLDGSREPQDFSLVAPPRCVSVDGRLRSCDPEWTNALLEQLTATVRQRKLKICGL